MIIIKVNRNIFQHLFENDLIVCMDNTFGFQQINCGIHEGNLKVFLYNIIKHL
jgi:hypothetical protein